MANLQELVWKNQRRKIRRLCTHSMEHVESAESRLEQVNRRPITAETVIERRTMIDHRDAYIGHIIDITANVDLD